MTVGNLIYLGEACRALHDVSNWCGVRAAEFLHVQEEHGPFMWYVLGKKKKWGR